MVSGVLTGNRLLPVTGWRTMRGSQAIRFPQIAARPQSDRRWLRRLRPETIADLAIVNIAVGRCSKFDAGCPYRWNCLAGRGQTPKWARCPSCVD